MIDQIRHKVILRIAHRQAPECIIRRELSCWEVQDVVVLPKEILICAIAISNPGHCLFRFL